MNISRPSFEMVHLLGRLNVASSCRRLFARKSGPSSSAASAAPPTPPARVRLLAPEPLAKGKRGRAAGTLTAARRPRNKVTRARAARPVCSRTTGEPRRATDGVILSLDLGEKNFAYCVVDRQTCQVLRWDRLNLEEQGVKTSNIESVYAYFHEFLTTGPVVEVVGAAQSVAAAMPSSETHRGRHRSRSGAGSSIPFLPPPLQSSSSSPSPPPPLLLAPTPCSGQQAAAAFSSRASCPTVGWQPGPLLGPSSVVLIENQVGARLRAMQAVAFSLFRSLASPNTLVAYPRKVHAHFGIGGAGWHGNKRASVSRCHDVLAAADGPGSGPGSREPSWQSFFQAARKQDDLADCYLQARWYFETTASR